MDDTEQAGNDGSIISAKYWSNIIIAGNMGEKKTIHPKVYRDKHS
jgi:hypothetical protein